MAALGSLIVQLAMDYAQYTAGLDKSEQETLARTKRMQDAMDGVKSTASSFAVGVGAAIAGVLSVSAFKDMLVGVTGAQVELKRLGEISGVSVEKLSGMAAIAKLSGTQVDQLGDSMNQLTQKMVETKKESDPAAVALQKIGINFKEFRDLTPDQQFLELAKSLDKFEDGAGKSAAIMAVMGEEGAKMLPFMKDLAAAGEIHAKVTEEQVAQSEQFQRALMASQASTDSLKTEFVNGMVPALNIASRAYNEVMNGTNGVREEARTLAEDGSIKNWTTMAVKALSYVVDAGQYVWRTFQSIGKGLAGLAASAVAVSDGDFKGAFGILQMSGQDMIDAFKGETWGEKFRAQIDALSTSAASAAPEIKKNTLAVKDFVQAGDEGAKAADKMAQAYAGLMASIGGKIEALQKEAELGRQLTDSEKELVKLESDLHTGKIKLTAAQTDSVKARIAEWTQAEKNAAALKDERAAIEAGRQARLKYIGDISSNALSLADGNKSLREEISLMGKSDETRTEILKTRNLEIIAIKQAHEAELLRNADRTGLDELELIALQDEITLLQERNGLLDTKLIVEGAVKGAEQTQEAWKSLYDNVSSSLTDALMNGGMNAKEYLKGMLRSLFVQPFVMNIVGNFMGMLGMGGTGGSGALGGGGGGVFGMANNASTLNTLWGAGSQFIFGGSAGASTASLAYANGVGLFGGDALGALYTANGGWAGVGAGGGAAAGGGSGAGMGGMGWGSAAVLIPLIAAYLGGMFKDEVQVGQGITGELGGDLYGYQLMRESGGLFDGPDYRYVIAEKEIKKTKAEIEALKNDQSLTDLGERGEAVREAKLQRLYNKLDGLERNYGAAIEGSQGPINILQEAFTSMREATAKQADSLGLDGDSVRAMKVALGLDEIHPDTGGKGLELTGLTQEEAQAKIQEALNQANEELARSVLGSWQEQTREVTRMVWESVQVDDGGDTERYIRVGKEVTETITENVWVMSEYVREGETAVQALGRLSSSLVGVNQVFDLLGATLVDASLAGGDWASKLVDAIGGMDALAAAASSYYDLYYSDDEKRSNATRRVDDGMASQGLDLRVSGPDAKAQYRALVDKAIADKDEALLAWLLEFADDFAAGVDAFTAGLDDAAAAMQEKLAEIARVREETLSALGLSMDGLVSGFITEINEGRGAQAGAWLADEIAAGFEQAVYQQAVNAILSSIIDGMITPMITAALTGSSMADAVSAAAIDNMIANANAALEALGTLLTSEGFIEGMEKIKVTITKLGNSMGASIPPMSSYHSSVASMGSAASNSAQQLDKVSDGLEKVDDSWQKLIDSMEAEVNRIRGVVAGDGVAGYAVAQQQFAVATAQARAGDADAAAQLPELSRAMLDFAGKNLDARDARYEQALTAASLEETMRIAQQYLGQPVTPKTSTTASGGLRSTSSAGSAASAPAPGSSTDPVVVALRVGFAQLDARLKVIETKASSTESTISTLEKQGFPVKNKPGTKLETV